MGSRATNLFSKYMRICISDENPKENVPDTIRILRNKLPLIFKINVNKFLKLLWRFFMVAFLEYNLIHKSFAPFNVLAPIQFQNINRKSNMFASPKLPFTPLLLLSPFLSSSLFLSLSFFVNNWMWRYCNLDNFKRKSIQKIF
jgi:hypothetical protein